MIPDEDSDLQMKLLEITHCGWSGNRWTDATESILWEMSYWNTMEEDFKEIVIACLRCMSSKTGHKVPRPISITVDGTRPNEVMYFDYLYMGLVVEEKKYVLVIRDHFSSYFWCAPMRNADAERSAEKLARWIRTFTLMEIEVSDQGPQFKNKIMTELANDHQVRHLFIVGYSP